MTDIRISSEGEGREAYIKDSLETLAGFDYISNFDDLSKLLYQVLVICLHVPSENQRSCSALPIMMKLIASLQEDLILSGQLVGVLFPL